MQRSNVNILFSFIFGDVLILLPFAIIIVIIIVTIFILSRLLNENDSPEAIISMH